MFKSSSVCSPKKTYTPNNCQTWCQAAHIATSRALEAHLNKVSRMIFYPLFGAWWGCNWPPCRLVTYGGPKHQTAYLALPFDFYTLVGWWPTAFPNNCLPGPIFDISTPVGWWPTVFPSTKFPTLGLIRAFLWTFILLHMLSSCLRYATPIKSKGEGSASTAEIHASQHDSTIENIDANQKTNNVTNGTHKDMNYSESW